MYTKDIVGLAEARAAADAAVAKAMENPDRPVSVAVVDGHGDPVYVVRMDNAVAFNTEMALNKAYTSARMRRDTGEALATVRKQGWDMSMYGDRRLTGIPGGKVIKNRKGVVVGAIGVSGRRTGVDKVSDTDIAVAGATAVEKIF